MRPAKGIVASELRGKRNFVTIGASKLEQIRIEKIPRITALGMDPWGSRFDGRVPIAELRKNAESLEPGTSGTETIRAAGRILGMRDKGKVYFIDLQDGSGRIQLFLGKNQIGEAGWELLQLSDLWDLIGVEGTLGKTKTGEPSIFVQALIPHAKTIAHPPEKYHGAQDIEIRLRRRYVDMVQDPAVLRRFETRARILNHIRRYLTDLGFLEVDTPMMQAIAGGAAARPFITHHNALDIDLYLRISPELYLKRLLVGGMEKVFEIGRVFRNEGIDATHNPEFTLLELYEAYADYHRMMEITEGLIVSLVDDLGLGREISFGGKPVNLNPPWRRATYAELLEEHAGVSVDDEAGLIAACEKRGLPVAGKDPDVLVSTLFEECVEDALEGPIFVLDYPASLCPLTKRKPSNPRFAERFELFIHGAELANAYTELNDPLLQESLFASQLAGLPEEESMAKMDRDFLLAQRHGMPPAGGLGIGVDRLIMLLTDTPTIRDVILFPLLRPERGPRGQTTDEGEAPSEDTGSDGSADISAQ